MYLAYQYYTSVIGVPGMCEQAFGGISNYFEDGLTVGR